MALKLFDSDRKISWMLALPFSEVHQNAQKDVETVSEIVLRRPDYDTFLVTCPLRKCWAHVDMGYKQSLLRITGRRSMGKEERDLCKES